MNTKAVIGVKPALPYSIEEAMNRLRINVSFLGGDIRRIMVVSSEPNEGKSFIAINLWKQMASAGEPSILIDADMRKSVMVENYRISREDGKELWGLSHYLSDNKKLEDCILTTDIPGGDLLPNVNNVVNPSMLLEGRRFGELLDILESRYRYVFLDDGGVAKRVFVKLGQRFDENIEVISDELQEGDRLVVVGQAKLVDGAKINVAREN